MSKVAYIANSGLLACYVPNTWPGRVRLGPNIPLALGHILKY
jgi:hypothetical protein